MGEGKMSKKMWCRKCRSMEMHDSRSQRHIQKQGRALQEIIDECQLLIREGDDRQDFAILVQELAEEGMKK